MSTAPLGEVIIKVEDRVTSRLIDMRFGPDALPPDEPRFDQTIVEIMRLQEIAGCTGEEVGTRRLRRKWRGPDDAYELGLTVDRIRLGVAQPEEIEDALLEAALIANPLFALAAWGMLWHHQLREFHAYAYDMAARNLPRGIRYHCRVGNAEIIGDDDVRVETVGWCSVSIEGLPVAREFVFGQDLRRIPGASARFR